MTARSTWKKDWVWGIALSLCAFAFYFTEPDAIAGLEGKVYDLAEARTERIPSDRIAIIAIDDASIANIGRWPWPRDVHAKLIEFLGASKAKVVAHLAFFSEPEKDRGLPYIERLVAEHSAATAIVNTSDDSGMKRLEDPLAKIGAILVEANEALDSDRKLATSFSNAGNVVLPMLFRIDANQPVGSPDKTLPPFVAASSIKPAGGLPQVRDLPLPATEVVSVPIDRLGESLSGVGHLHSNADKDGIFRSEPLVVDYFGYLVPSLALTVSAKSLGITPKEMRVHYGQGLQLGNLTIETGPHLSMRTHFYQAEASRQPFTVDSFFDVVSGKVSPEKYRDKIVLIGPTAAGVVAPLHTPISASTPPVMVLAHNVSSLLQRHFIASPGWGELATLAGLVIVSLYITVFLPRLASVPSALISAALLGLLIAVPYFAITRYSTWLQLMLPATLLAIGHLLLTSKRFFMAEAGKALADAESAESNRMLGLSLQGQGQLDMAFDKLRRIPINEPLMDTLYGLALDFERKRQFNKAEVVFQYMSDFNPNFRDLKEKLNRAKQLSQTVMLGGGSGNAGATLITGAGVEKPMLGRYQVEKELGRGAMGTVYLGRDPKIGRLVAIKTMALGKEFEGDELQEARERFFREAETAGRLNHPHIVTIFDAGEEHDLAYIAMEYLKGKDLTSRTKLDALFAYDKLVSVVTRVAEALDYAHKNNVVHRDIKPANIMYEEESDTVKVTDFGIARITDSSRTKTGMVLGTPSYMSPEQLSGQRIDGRSDLYSLGVAFYVLASGRLPFDGESMAALMFRIANDAPPDIRQFNPQLSGSVVAFINKAMAKDPSQRFQNGAQFAHALRIASGAAGMSSPPIRAASAAL
ncbi:MAG: CHASE2 domain-containing serine/threonine-protein kinase [Burkholderiales bacterium]